MSGRQTPLFSLYNKNVFETGCFINENTKNQIFDKNIACSTH